MRVALTGATGFVGRHLHAILSGSGHDVISVPLSDRLSAPDPDALRLLLAPALGADVIVNLAAALKPSTSVDLFVTADMPSILARLLLDTGSDKRLIHVSTANVPIAALGDLYTRAKRRAEAALSGMAVQIFRPGLIWSWRGEGPARIVDRYFRTRLPVHPFLYPGNRYRPILVEDFAAFLAQEIAGMSTSAGTATTILGDTPCTLWELAQGYAHLHARRIAAVPSAGLARLIPGRRLYQSQALVQLLDIDRATIPLDGSHVLLPFRWPERRSADLSSRSYGG